MFILKLKSDVQHLTDKNDKLFYVNSTVPRIILRRENEQHNTQIVEIKREYSYHDIDWILSTVLGTFRT
jgi:hypothetical protein